MTKYDPSSIEPKWIKLWDSKELYKAKDLDKKPKKYLLIEFPYPSGERLHVGHGRSYCCLDAMARLSRMKGFNVLYPLGWDAFGLPAENYAIKTGINPAVTTKQNIANAKAQAKSWGLSFDWSREIDTTDPNYYKWTQWIFLQLFKKGLAYQSDIAVNWCPKCKTNLADEEVLADGTHERCGCQTERRKQKQWLIKITAYAEQLLDDLKLVNYREDIAKQQINWIGKKEGIEITYQIKKERHPESDLVGRRIPTSQPVILRSKATKDPRGILRYAQNDEEGTQNDVAIQAFTTRPDTMFGATFIVLSPEHPLALKITTSEYTDNVYQYIETAKNKSELERISEGKKKTGAFTGAYAINPLNNQKMPIYISDFVLMSFGTGAVVGVPGHDKRDFEFAKEFKLPIIRVVTGKDNDTSAITEIDQVQEEEGKIVNSGFLDGLSIDEAMKKVMDYLEEKGIGKRSIFYHLRDWVFSRQHYWGEPIPIIHCERCKNKKYKYLLLHGYTGSSKQDFFPWLKKELEALGHQVYSPDMPNTEEPKVEEQADYVIKNFEIDSDTIIIGHSLGGAVALNILEKVNKKVAKVVLVDSLIYPRFTDKKRPHLERTFHWKFNFEKIKKLSNEFIDLADQNFPIIPKEQFEEKNKQLETRLLYVKPNANHFNSRVEPLILEYAKMDGIHGVPEKDLPIKLPYLEKYQPSGTGESPLARVTDWVNTKCPVCGGPAKRETDTMPNWAGSNWYFIRYLDPKNDQKLCDPEKLKYWMPVDLYNGGMEHTTLHLLYSRFIYKFLFNIGAVPGPEPYARRWSHGVILGPDNQKMSKSRGNVINPDEIVKKYGADTFRLYEAFIGPFEQMAAWEENGVIGCYRFLNRVWELVNYVVARHSKPTNLCHCEECSDEAIPNEIATLPPVARNDKMKISLSKSAKKIENDIWHLSFNTAIASLMELMNDFYANKEKLTIQLVKDYLILLAPFAPFTAEELWQKVSQVDILSNDYDSVHQQAWPTYDEKLLIDKEVTIAIQINGKLRDVIRIMNNESRIKEKVEELARNSEKIAQFLKGKKIIKVIYVPGRLINFVID